jgi:trigger factor
MQSTVTQKNSYTLSIEIKESGVEFEKAKKAVIEEIRIKGKVKGFKAGSAIPEHVIIREYGEAGIEQQALDELVGRLYPKVLKKENIIPVWQGNITELKSKNPLELTIEVEIFPTIEIDEKKLAKIKVKKTPVKWDKEAEVDAEIARIQSQFTHFHEAGHHSHDGADTSHIAIEKGDRVTISAQGYDKKWGDAIPETRVPNYPLVIGSGSFIPGFEEELIGAKAGDEVSFDITFPKDYHSDDFKGRKVHFTASIEKVEKPHVQELDEDFIEKLRGVRTDLAGLRELIAKDLEAKHEYDARAKDEDILMKEMMEVATFEVGPSLIAAEVEQVYREHSENLMQQGYEMKQYLDHLKKSADMYKDEIVKPEALRRVKAELLLRKIRELKAIEPTEDEVKSEVEKVIAQYGSAEVIERLRAKLVPGDTYYEDIKNRLAYRKVVDTFFE